MTDTLNRETVEALLALEAKATPGPYCVKETRIWCGPDDAPNAPMFKPHTGYRRWGREFTRDERTYNPELLVAARNLIRPLAESYLATLDAPNNLRGESATVARTITAVHPVVGSGEQEDPTLIARRLAALEDET